MKLFEIQKKKTKKIDELNRALEKFEIKHLTTQTADDLLKEVKHLLNQ